MPLILLVRAFQGPYNSCAFENRKSTNLSDSPAVADDLSIVDVDEFDEEYNMVSNDVSETAHLLDGAQPFDGIIENENVESDGSSKGEFITEMQKELGKPNPVSYPPMRLPLMKFHTGRLFVNLNLVADYNVRDQEYDPPEARLNLSMGEKRVWLPTDPETVRLLGEFLVSVASVLVDMDFPHKDYNIEEIRKLLKSYGCVADE